MKRTSLILAFILSFILKECRADEGLVIIHEDLTRAIEVAKAQKKLILIDFYTDWCRPCKVFDRQLAKDSQMQRFIAQNYLILKYNAEKDSAFGLSVKYSIFSYPTFVVIDANQRYYDKLFGGEIGLDSPDRESTKAFLLSGAQLYARGAFKTGYSPRLDLAYPEFYRKRRYAKKGELEAYWSRKDLDPFSEVYFAMFTYSTIMNKLDSTRKQHYLNLRDKYTQLYGSAAVMYNIRKMVSQQYRAAVKQASKKRWNQAHNLAAVHLGADELAEAEDAYRFPFLLALEDWKATELYLDSLIPGANAEDINYYCWYLYLSCKDTALLRKAETWIQGAIEKNENFAILDTYGSLLYKNKKYKKAKMTMEKAIALAKANGDDFSESQKMLDKINKEL